MNSLDQVVDAAVADGHTPGLVVAVHSASPSLDDE